MINVAIIGYGYWGPNLVRNFFSLDNVRVLMVADSRQERLDLLSKSFPSIQTTLSSESIMNNKEIDAVIIATPVLSHYSLAREALLKEKHVLVEKPMTVTLAEADDLIELAAQ